MALGKMKRPDVGVKAAAVSCQPLSKLLATYGRTVWPRVSPVSSLKIYRVIPLGVLERVIFNDKERMYSPLFWKRLEFFLVPICRVAFLPFSKVIHGGSNAPSL